jgi:hypothetical protein
MSSYTKLGFYIGVALIGLSITLVGIKYKDETLTTVGLLTMIMTVCFAVSVA